MLSLILQIITKRFFVVRHALIQLIDSLSTLYLLLASVVDPDPHQIKRQDPDPNPHQSYKLDPEPDPHQFADDTQKCMDYEHFFQVRLFPPWKGLEIEPDLDRSLENSGRKDPNQLRYYTSLGAPDLLTQKVRYPRKTRLTNVKGFFTCVISHSLPHSRSHPSESRRDTEKTYYIISAFMSITASCGPESAWIHINFKTKIYILKTKGGFLFFFVQKNMNTSPLKGLRRSTVC